MAEALHELADHGFHVLHGLRGISHLAIGPQGVFAVESGSRPNHKQLEHMRSSARQAGQAFAQGLIDVVPVFVTPGGGARNAGGVMVVDEDSLVGLLETQPTVLSDQQCHGLAARAKVMLAQVEERRLETVKPPSRLPALLFVLLVMLSFSAGVAAFANSVLG